MLTEIALPSWIVFSANLETGGSLVVVPGQWGLGTHRNAKTQALPPSSSVHWGDTTPLLTHPGTGHTLRPQPRPGQAASSHCPWSATCPFRMGGVVPPHLVPEDSGIVC